jgi:hypothetical protein
MRFGKIRLVLQRHAKCRQRFFELPIVLQRETEIEMSFGPIGLKAGGFPKSRDGLRELSALAESYALHKILLGGSGLCDGGGSALRLCRYYKPPAQQECPR